MSKYSRIIPAVVCAVMTIVAAIAGDFPITDFGGNGSISWESTMSNAEYRVEWCSDLTTPDWRASWDDLVEILPSGSSTTTSVPMFYRVIATQPRTVLFSDYIPRDPNENGRKTIEWVNLGGGSPLTNLLTNVVVGFESAAYLSGALYGTKTLNATTEEDWTTFLNDGRTVRILGFGGWFVCSDTNFSAHAESFAFDEVYDGMYKPSTNYWGSAPANVEPEADSTPFLVKIDTITMPAGTFTNAIALWWLGLDTTHQPLVDEWRLNEIGLTFPSSDETRGVQPHNVDIYARGIGFIGGMEIVHGSNRVENAWKCLSITN